MRRHHEHRDDGGADYYTATYRSYPAQNPPKKLDHYLHVVDDQIGAEPPLLLDFGCGPGLFLQHVLERRPGWRLHGADLDSAPLREFRQSVGGAIEIEPIVPGSRPFEGTRFDVVTSWDVLEHVADPVETLHAIAEWLRPGGALIFVVPVFDGPFGPVIRNLDHDPTHLHRESRDYWLDHAGEVFSIVSWHGIFRYLVGSNWYVHVASRLMRQVTPSILVVCRRR